MKIPSEYQEIIDKYPQYVSKNQMFQICKISPITALHLFDHGLVPVIKSEKCTHKYRVAVVDIVAYLIDRGKHPDKYHFSRRPKERETIIYPSDNDIQKFRTYLEKAFEEYDDILTSMQTARITGYGINTINRWIEKKWVKAFLVKRSYRIPKQCLLDFFTSPKYFALQNKPQKMIDVIRGFIREQ